MTNDDDVDDGVSTDEIAMDVEDEIELGDPDSGGGTPSITDDTSDPDPDTDSEETSASETESVQERSTDTGPKSGYGSEPTAKNGFVPPQTSQTQPSAVRVSDIKTIPTKLSEHPFGAQALVPAAQYGTEYLFIRNSQKGGRGPDFDGGSRMAHLTEETTEMFDQLHELLEEDVYPDVSVGKIDFMEAVILAGLQNPEFVEQVLTTWGYQKKQNRTL